MAPAAFRGEQDAVASPRVIGAEQLRELRHPRLKRIADEERRGTGEQDHRHDPRFQARIREGAGDLGKAERPHSRVPVSMTGVWDPPHEDAEWHVDQDVRQ